ncbi:hypothetical protein F5B20DRAFT_496897 [Whalleya microplaca]|nr:hypothetical protein F5B20DRAFT_496897 [Whalleya microplaca]
MDMSAQSSPSPRALPGGPRQPVDGNKFPNGQCRYILLNPEIKGQRCACVGFTINRSLPSVTCECGHLSCYHIKSAESTPDKNEVDSLRRRIQHLEEQLDRESGGGLGGALGTVVRRLGDLEDQVERNKEETGQETKDCYRNVDRVWQSVTQLEKRQALNEDRFLVYDERLDGHDDTLQRLDDRLMEFDEASMTMEERVEALEEQAGPRMASRRHSRTSTSDPEASKNCQWTAAWADRSSSHRDNSEAALIGPDSRWAVKQAGGSGSTTVPWTVHVSLLPTASQPFPFEKDTNAYKRCLSRGLHQMIAVSGTDGESFVRAISKAFGSLLKGREWVPLQARLCDAAKLQGLPMLRPLDPALIGSSYGLKFLQKYCAVCSPNGKVESLYIAMLSDTFSWHFLRRSPCHLEGLEESWAYDPLLDPDDNFGDDEGLEEVRRSAGEIVPPLPSLKRTATAEGSESSRQKLPRTGCIQAPMELRRRGVETV